MVKRYPQKVRDEIVARVKAGEKVMEENEQLNWLVGELSLKITRG